jgi:phosphate transport system substrate-binding protein
MKMFFKILLVSILLSPLLHTAQAFDWGLKSTKRNYIYLVGSSTISPLMAAASEEFSRSKAVTGSPIETPIVEATGSIAGFKFFCSGIGYRYPDFVNASMAITKKELEHCHNNGIKNLMEIKIGYDGIVIANIKGGKKLNLTKRQIFLALAEKIYDQGTQKLIDNPYRNWKDIDPKLPNTAIVFYGPPITSGTRNIFTDLIMETSCMEQVEFVNLFTKRSQLKKQCHKIRNDGVFIASGENDDNIIRALNSHNSAFGIFGFNFLVANAAKIQSISIDGVKPTHSTISSKKYSLSRPLFIYFKVEHLGLIPELKNFIKEIINPETIGKKGYLIHGGLVPLHNSELTQLRKKILLQLQ